MYTTTCSPSLSLAAFGNSIILGSAQAVDTLAAQAFGARNFSRVGLIAQRGIAVSLAFCIPVALAWYNAGPLLGMLGQHEDVVVYCQGYLRLLLIGLPASTIFEVLKKYLLSVGLATPPMTINAIGVSLSAVLHYIFVYETSLGFYGSPIATAISQWVMLAILVLYIYKHRAVHDWMKRVGLWKKESDEEGKDAAAVEGFPGFKAGRDIVAVGDPSEESEGTNNITEPRIVAFTRKQGEAAAAATHSISFMYPDTHQQSLHGGEGAAALGKTTYLPWDETELVAPKEHMIVSLRPYHAQSHVIVSSSPGDGASEPGETLSTGTSSSGRFDPTRDTDATDADASVFTTHTSTPMDCGSTNTTAGSGSCSPVHYPSAFTPSPALPSLAPLPTHPGSPAMSDVGQAASPLPSPVPSVSKPRHELSIEVVTLEEHVASMKAKRAVAGSPAASSAATAAGAGGAADSHGSTAIGGTPPANATLDIDTLLDLTWTGWDFKGAMRSWPEYLALGLPSAAMLFSEWASYEATSLIAGYISTGTLAAHTILATTASLSFMPVLGYGVAVGIRVGQRMGEKSARGARIAYRAVMWLAGSFLIINAILILSVSKVWGRVFTDDAATVKYVADWLWLLALYSVFDGAQCMCSGVLRGLGRPTIAATANVLSYMGIGLSLSYVFAVTYGQGLAGIWTSYILAVICAYALMRFWIGRLDWDKIAVEAHERAMRGGSPLAAGGH